MSAKMSGSDYPIKHPGERVGPERRGRIETFLLASEAHKEKLAFAKTLRDGLPRRRALRHWLPRTFG
jgi:hypothetical protein